MSKQEDMKLGQSIRCGKWRITYRPDWDASLPYVTYDNGTAGCHFGSLIAAQRYFDPRAKNKWTDPS